MKHARLDYASIQPWPTKRPHIGKIDGVTYRDIHVSNAEVDPIIPDDEPVFLIRGQDLAAIPAAEAWCEAAERLGADAAVVEAVRDHIELVRAWQEEKVAKVPDAPAEALPV